MSSSFYPYFCLIDALGPFEAQPRLAVAVSGGADSMALCLLAQAWAQAQGGMIVALVVDHGLRAESGAEARQTAAWLAAYGVQALILPWKGAPPASAVQARARQARYHLMGQWCRSEGVLHLLVGHHADDQAETVAMRREKGSGLDGLAAMPAISEMSWGRLLRPLLGLPKAELQGMLTALDQPWIEDSSNRNFTFHRVRIRAALAESANKKALVAEAVHQGRERVRREAETAALLGRCCTIYPAGFALFDQKILTAASRIIAGRALGGVLSAVGGRYYRAGRSKVERLFDVIAEDGDKAARTLSGCRVMSWRGRLLICREERGLPAPRRLRSGERLVWDGRFLATAAVDGLSIAPLGQAGWQDVSQFLPSQVRQFVPAPVRAALPAFYANGNIFSVPSLSYYGGRRRDLGGVIEFRPPKPIAGSGFYVAPLVFGAIS